MIHQENVMILSTYTPTISVPKFIKQPLLDISGKIVSDTRGMGDLNIPLSKIVQLGKKLGKLRINGISLK
jgi:hypothetical protein